MSVPLPELALMVALMLAGGALTGLLAGVFGVGGGAVMVPILYEVFGLYGVPLEVRMPLAVGTSLAAIIPTSISSFRKHLSKGLVEHQILRIWAIPVLAGVVIGSWVARFAPADLFKAVFIVVAGLSAIRLLFGRDSWRISETLPSTPVMAVIGLVIGVLSTLMGIGGGQLASLFMMLYGRSIHQAVSTSAGLGVIISIPGALGMIYAGWPKMDLLPVGSLGYVSLIAFACLIPTSVWMAPKGAQLAHWLPKRRLEIAFGLFLCVVVLRFLFTLFGAF